MSRRTGAHKPAHKSVSDVSETSGTTPAGEVVSSHRKINLARWIAGSACLAVAVAVYLLRLDRVVGMVVDDGWYVLLAKALAAGEGYRLINAPTPDLMPFYPPGFPFLLSFIFRLAPDFPANIPLLKSISILASLGAGVVAYWYFTRLRRTSWYFALGVATATTLAPSLVYLSTAMVMSEPLFLFLQITTIALVERGVQDEKKSRVWMWILLGGLCAGFAMLVRTAAVALTVGGLIYLVWKRRRRESMIFAIGVAILFGPWMIYSRMNAPTMEQRQEQNGYIVQDYATQFWQRRAGEAASGTIGVGEIPARVWRNLSRIATNDTAELLMPTVYEPLKESGAIGGISFFLFFFVVAGLAATFRERATMAEIAVPLTVGVVLLWPWDTLRFVIPLLPFVIFYLLVGLRLVYHLHLRLRQEPMAPGWAGLTGLAALLIALNLYGNIEYIRTKFSTDPKQRPALMRAFDENLETLEWINNRLPVSAVVATENPALVYLYTGRRTLAIDNPGANWATWQRLKVSHMARIWPLPLGQPNQAERRYSIVYQSSGELGLRVIDLGPPESREPWGTMTPRITNMIR